MQDVASLDGPAGLLEQLPTSGTGDRAGDCTTCATPILAAPEVEAPLPGLGLGVTALPLPLLPMLAGTLFLAIALTRVCRSCLQFAEVVLAISRCRLPSSSNAIFPGMTSLSLHDAVGSRSNCCTRASETTRYTRMHCTVSTDWDVVLGAEYGGSGGQRSTFVFQLLWLLSFPFDISASWDCSATTFSDNDCTWLDSSRSAAVLSSVALAIL